MHDAGRDVLDGADVLVPVPLHPLKTWRRGFNQADVLARCLPLPRVIALRRHQLRHAQAGLSAGARGANVRGAFAPSWRNRLGRWLLEGRGCRLAPAGVRRVAARRWSVAGRVVVLIDDVRTTGATLTECARVLHACGAREIRALTVARVDRR
jgi:predicted amidophosphoribosyltransferase